MLTEIAVKNIAVLENIRIPFSEGFNVITGETGAGKSILIESLKLALGYKLPPAMVPRDVTGVVEISFFVEDLGGVMQELEEGGIPSDGTLIMRRNVAPSGRSRTYVNDAQVTGPFVAGITSDLVSILGQHGYQSLFGSKNAVRLYDGFCGIGDLMKEYGKAFRGWRKVVRDMEAMKEEAPHLESKVAWLTASIKELEALGLNPGEEAEIEKELPILKDGAKIKEGLAEVINAIDHGDESALSRLGEASSAFRKVSRIAEELDELARRLDDHLYALTDLSRDILLQVSRIDLDEGRYEDLQERLSRIKRLSRKYETGTGDLGEKLGELRKEREECDSTAKRIESLEREEKRTRKRVFQLASSISENRLSVKGAFEGSVMKELSALGLGGVQFKISFHEEEDGVYTLMGSERVEFLFSPSPSFEPGPLVQVASGGELSRIMLALHNTVVEKGRFSTLIFDEVDAGIGGKMAERVGEKLRSLSSSSQVICITHLPQIAALADHHVKIANEGGVKTSSRVLAGKERVAEIARMVSGEEITEEAVQYAEMLLAR